MGKHEIEDNYETNELYRLNSMFMRATPTAQRTVTKSVQRNCNSLLQGDKKKCVNLMITVLKKTQKYFKQFQSLTAITWLELGIRDGVSVSLVFLWPWRSAAKQTD
jgi:hypothetical protein